MNDRAKNGARRTADNKPIWVFTPSRTDPKDLEFIFVQRRDLLQDAVERVRESALTDHKHHLLFVGPRGCGKTHLITLIVERLSQESDLADRLRIAWLNEDETCTTLLELLLKIHAALERRHPDEYREEMLSAAYEMTPAAAQEYVAKQLLDVLGSRTLLVIVENLDAIFDSLGDAGQKKLRAFIQENPKFSVVATAQRLVENLSDRTSPFFGFFQTEHLKPLNVEEATELLQKIARLHNQIKVVEFLSTSRGRSRVRALHHLSGGNHRIYIVLSQFITSDSIDALVGPFMKMVDELTPYYQERVRWLPALQRKIVEYLCGCEITVPVKEIAKKLFTTPQSISKQLQDLREKGYVEASERGRESLYEISEPLMRICVEVKENQSHQPLRLLVDFLRVWYDDEELSRRLGKLEPATASRAYLELAIERNRVEGNLRKKLFIQDLRLTLPEQMDPSMKDVLIGECANLPEEVVLAMKILAEGDIPEAIRYLSAAIEEAPDSPSMARLLLARAQIYQLCQHKEKELQDYTAVIGLPGLPAGPIAIALNRRGITYGENGETQRAIEDMTAASGLPGASVEQIAMALLNRGVAYDRVGDTEHATKDFTSVIGLPGALVEQVATALIKRGLTYREAGDTQCATNDFTAVVGLPGASAEEVARAHLSRGFTYHQVGDMQRAIEDYTAVIELSGAPVEAVAIAYYARGMTYIENDQRESAQKDFDVIVRLENAPISTVVDAYMVLSMLYFLEGRWNEGFGSLEAGFARGAKEQPPYFRLASDLIGVVFSAGLSPEARLDKVMRLVAIYKSHQALSLLGEGLLEHIGSVYRAAEPFPSADNLDQWASAWEKAGENVDDFRLSLRLLRTAVEFIKAGGKDPGILLHLTSTERQIVRQALGLEEKNPE